MKSSITWKVLLFHQEVLEKKTIAMYLSHQVIFAPFRSAEGRRKEDVEVSPYKVLLLHHPPSTCQIEECNQLTLSCIRRTWYLLRCHSLLWWCHQFLRSHLYPKLSQSKQVRNKNRRNRKNRLINRYINRKKRTKVLNLQKYLHCQSLKSQSYLK